MARCSVATISGEDAAYSPISDYEKDVGYRGTRGPVWRLGVTAFGEIGDDEKSVCGVVPLAQEAGMMAI